MMRISPKKLIMLQALAKPLNAKELADKTKVNPVTVRRYLKELETENLIEKIKGEYPNTYRLIKPIEDIEQRAGIKREQISKISTRNVETLVEMLKNDEPPQQNKLLQLTYDMLREFKTKGGERTQLTAAAKVYIELGYALDQIAKE